MSRRSRRERPRPTVNGAGGRTDEGGAMLFAAFADAGDPAFYHMPGDSSLFANSSRRSLHQRAVAAVAMLPRHL